MYQARMKTGYDDQRKIKAIYQRIKLKLGFQKKKKKSNLLTVIVLLTDCEARKTTKNREPIC